MRNIFRIIVSLSALLAVSVSAFADGKTAEEAIKREKTVVFDELGNPVSLRLETFVTGDGQNNTIITTETKPLDVVFVLDVSGSMKDRVAAGSYMKFAKTSDVTVLQWRLWFTGISNIYIFENGVYREVEIKQFLGFGWGFRYKDNNKNVSGDHDIYVNATKLETLKIACENFINAIETNANASKANHRIGVITFASSANVAQTLTTNYQSVKENAIQSLTANGATRADLGMEKVDGVFGKDLTNENRTRIVVMFTDGAPTSSSNFEDKVANAAIKASSITKAAGVKVYTVGIFDTKTDKIETFMSRLSSNYPDATSMTSNSMPGNLQTYYRKASSSTQLVDVFETIAHEATNNTSQADYFLETSSVTVQDVISEYFTIPNTDSPIRVSIVPIKDKGIAGTGDQRTYQWDYANADNDPTSVIVLPVTTDGDETVVKVQGFDFNKNWVGIIQTKVNGRVTETKYVGAKLVIEIDIEPKPEFAGGVVPTNNPDKSGVYVGGDSIVKYVCDPGDVLVPTVNLVVKKSGLQPGESVIYHISRNGDSSFGLDLVLTADANGNAVGTARVCAVSAKDTFYTYNVTEKAGAGEWAWAYKSSSVPSKTLYNSSRQLTNEFVFPAAELNGKGASVLYGEAAENNIFSE